MEKEKPHKCEYCHKRYKNLNGLKYVCLIPFLPSVIAKVTNIQAAQTALYALRDRCSSRQPKSWYG